MVGFQGEKMTKDKIFFHYYTMDMHRKCMDPLFAELKRRGWTEGIAGNPRRVAFVPSGDLIRPEFKAQSPIIWIPHGLSPSKWAYPRELGGKSAELPDFLLLPGPMYASRITKALPSYLQVDIPYEIVGWPKSDELFDGSLQPATCEHPLVLFAPSWNHKTNDSVGTYSFADQVRERLRGMPATLMVAPHPVYHKLQEDVLRESNLNRWLLAADVVITDQSSIGIEAACIDTPVVHLFELLNSRGWSRNDGEQFVVGHMATLDTLFDCVMDALDRPDRYAFMRRYWQQASLAYPGEGAKRAADAVERFSAQCLEC